MDMKFELTDSHKVSRYRLPTVLAADFFTIISMALFFYVHHSLPHLPSIYIYHITYTCTTSTSERPIKDGDQNVALQRPQSLKMMGL